MSSEAYTNKEWEELRKNRLPGCCHTLHVEGCSDCKACFAATASLEASIVELRRALELVQRTGGFRLGTNIFHPHVESAVKAALAQPAPQAALRGLLLAMGARICVEGIRDEGHIGQMADAILKGES